MTEKGVDRNDPPAEFEPPGTDDIGAVVAFYERTGAMPLNTIGPPIDRPIIPSRRPDRVGDFQFSPGANAASPPETADANDPEGERIRKQFLDMLHEELKGL
jgi:hypothetical protein